MRSVARPGLGLSDYSTPSTSSLPFMSTAMTETETVSRSQVETVKSIPDIEDSIGSTEPEDYRSVTCRYYTKLYCVDADREKSEDILVLNHSNKICLITLAPTHPVLAQNLSINKVNFEVSKKVDRKSNKTSGKSKKGGQALETTSVLAIVETNSGRFPVKVGRLHSCWSKIKFSHFRPWFPGN